MKKTILILAGIMVLSGIHAQSKKKANPERNIIFKDTNILFIKLN